MTGASAAAGEDLEVLPYQDSLVAAHQRFAAKMWPSKRRRREERFNRWKFRGPASGDVDGLLLAVSGGEVVGQTGVIPVVIDIDGQRLRCQWICDIIVDQSQRRRGLASKLFEAAFARGIVTLGSDPSPSADAAMVRNGFRPLVGATRAVFPLDPAHMVSWKMPRAASIATPLLGAALRPFFRWHGRAMYGAASERLGVTRGAWRSVAPLIAERQERQREPHIVHDEDFLRWRCDGLPGFTEPAGALWTGDGSYAIVAAGTPNYYVYDWGAASWESCRALFSAIREMAHDAKAPTLQAYANDDTELAWLRRLGFLTLRRPVSVLCHPPEKFLPRHARMRYSIFDSDGNL